MTVTVEEAKANLPQIIAKAEAGEEILIAHEQGRPTVKLVPLAPKASRLTRHPDLAGSTKTHDPSALLKPLPIEDWGELADR